MKLIVKMLVALLTLLAVSGSAGAAISYSVTSECEYVKAYCKGNTVYIEIDAAKLKSVRPDLSGYIAKAAGEYKVRGTKKYKTLTVGIMGQDIFPYIMLLRSDGAIEYIDVNQCIEKRKFSISGTIAKVKDVTAFENALCDDDEGGYITILAIHKGGVRTDLAGYVN